MRRHVREQLVRVLDRWLPGEIDRVVATSGTARTVVSVVHGVDRSERRDADRLRASAGEVAGLMNVFVGTTSEERSRVTGVGRRRAEVLPAGVVVLHEIVAGLGVPALYYSAAGLSDGIIAELAGSFEASAAPTERRDYLDCR
jgi:exopolyphosphatase/guanosine-5'-triphosphate,3'-diphosphate pyrophosphatase